jgi:hypothetical protein
MSSSHKRKAVSISTASLTAAPVAVTSAAGTGKKAAKVASKGGGGGGANRFAVLISDVREGDNSDDDDDNDDDDHAEEEEEDDEDDGAEQVSGKGTGLASSSSSTSASSRALSVSNQSHSSMGSSSQQAGGIVAARIDPMVHLTFECFHFRTLSLQTPIRFDSSVTSSMALACAIKGVCFAFASQSIFSFTKNIICVSFLSGAWSRVGPHRRARVHGRRNRVVLQGAVF